MSFKSYFVFLSKLFTIYIFSISIAFAAMAHQQADLVVVVKSKAQLSLYSKGKLLKKFHIAMGANPVGHKMKEGDQKTPEGRYTLDYKKSDSAFYRSIHISYPNAADRLQAKALGLNPGGLIMIHGQDPNARISPKKMQQYNWTNGCIAVTNNEMDEIWQRVQPGTPIEIWP